MKRLFAIAKGVILDSMSFRIHYLFSCVSNLFYIIIIYFLWKSIYESGLQTSNNMTFKDTFIYLALASSMFNLFKTWVDWDMSRSVINGSIITYLIRPIHYYYYILLESFGKVISNFVIICIPSIALIIFLTQGEIQQTWNIAFFALSVILSYAISFNIDYATGLTSFYTESIWGINMAKDVIVMLLSGVLVPIPLFPDYLQGIVQFLPFQAIYNTPVLIFVSKSLAFEDCIRMIGIQIFWVLFLFVLNKLYFRQTSKVIIVNGG